MGRLHHVFHRTLAFNGIATIYQSLERTDVKHATSILWINMICIRCKECGGRSVPLLSAVICIHWMQSRAICNNCMSVLRYNPWLVVSFYSNIIFYSIIFYFFIKALPVVVSVPLCVILYSFVVFVNMRIFSLEKVLWKYKWKMVVHQPDRRYSDMIRLTPAPWRVVNQAAFLVAAFFSSSSGFGSPLVSTP